MSRADERVKIAKRRTAMVDEDLYGPMFLLCSLCLFTEKQSEGSEYIRESGDVVGCL